MADKIFDLVVKAMVFCGILYAAFLILRWAYLHT
jgi:hypothetical protein